MKFKAKFFCGIFICLMTTAWLHGESKDSLVVKMNLKGYFPSDQEDNEKVFLAQPMALARNAKGNIYVYDYKWNTISIFDSEGKFISKTGKRGQGPGEFQSVRRVLPDGENIIILDSMKHEICHLDSKGKYLKSFKTFKSYNDFAIDHNGRIYCAPLASSVNPFLVDVLDESGNLLYSFGTPIRKFEKFSDSFLNNTKIVCDGKSITILFITIALVQQYDLNGKLVRECTFKELPDIKNKEEKMNLNQIKNMIPGKTPISHLFDTIYYDNGAYYVLRNRDNGIEIIKLDSFLNIERRFTYSDINESLYLSLDFIVGDEGGKPIFYIARMLPIARIENISPL